ncbi:MAG TPA: hypothetical protein VFU02_17060, partial [Polyangiaceae bacterium]|nr:hypothetical protein [Polyangiaceae bacterium]
MNVPTSPDPILGARIRREAALTHTRRVIAAPRAVPSSLVNGKRGDDLHTALADIPGRENVGFVALDLCDPYKPLRQILLPQRPARRRRVPRAQAYRARPRPPSSTVTATRDNAYLRRLLLRNRRSLKPWWRTR